MFTHAAAGDASRASETTCPSWVSQYTRLSVTASRSLTGWLPLQDGANSDCQWALGTGGPDRSDVAIARTAGRAGAKSPPHADPQ